MGGPWPQFVYLGLVFVGVGVGINAARYGEPKTGRYSASDVFVGPIVGLGLLFLGGFFDPLVRAFHG